MGVHDENSQHSLSAGLREVADMMGTEFCVETRMWVELSAAHAEILEEAGKELSVREVVLGLVGVLANVENRLDALEEESG